MTFKDNEKELHGILLEERAPKPGEYKALRQAVGWPPVEDQAALKGLEGSLYAVCALKAGEVVGCGRVAGDGGIYFYLQDLIVLPAHQGHGLGRLIMTALLDFINATAWPSSFIGLMAAQGAAGFYHKFGFRERPEGQPGMFRMVEAAEGGQLTEKQP